MLTIIYSFAIVGLLALILRFIESGGYIARHSRPPPTDNEDDQSPP